MKKVFTLILASIITLPALAQTFSDDFEGYNAGDYIGSNSVDWTTWSGTTGGTEDVQVTTTQAASGASLIYFSSTSANGGPQDVVLPFGGQYNYGTFSFEANMYVENGKGAYWNIQGETTIGNEWSINFQWDTDGNLYVYNNEGVVAQVAYTYNTWFNVRLDIDLSLNTWEAFIDGSSIGSWVNDFNQVASVDIFPLQNHGFFMDDVAYTYTPYTLGAENLGVGNIAFPGILNANNVLEGQQVPFKVSTRNLGTSTITSFDIQIDYNGTQINESITGANITSLSWFDYTFTAPVTIAAGSQAATVTISNVNGNGQDDDAGDDALAVTINSITPAAGKVVVAEEGTGTWCGWCPRGLVAMENIAIDYDGYVAPIAIHNGDPMVVTDYDVPFSNSVSGYPSGRVDRGGEMDPGDFPTYFVQNITNAPVTFIENGATWDAGSRTLNISLTTTFQQAATGNYKLAVVLTEDGVTGSSSAYSQTNYYSSSSQDLDLIDRNGTNWRDLPATVHYSQMVYDHVARVISPSFTGLPNAFGTSMNQNDAFTHNFTFIIPANYDETKLHIVGMVIAPNGSIDNAGYTTMDEAITNGFVSGTDVTAAVQTLEGPENVKLYPNPANEIAYVDVALDEAAEVEMTIYDMQGKVMASRNYGQENGSFKMPILTNDFSSGLYMVHVRIGNDVKVFKLSVE